MMKRLSLLAALAMMILPSICGAIAVEKYLITAPTTYTNGVKLPDSAIQKYTLYCGPTSGNYTLKVTFKSTASSFDEAITQTNSLNGTNYCAIAASVNGKEGPKSDEVSFVCHRSSGKLLCAKGGK